MVRAIFVLGALLSVSVPGAFAESVRVGLVPEQNIFEQVRRHRPLEAYLEAETGLDLELTVVDSYQELLAKFSDGGLDGGFFGSLIGAVAIEHLEARPIARPLRLETGSGYRSILLVREQSEIDDLEDLLGLSLAFVDKATTAGYVFPVAYMRGRGIEDIESSFSEIIFTGSHDAAIRAVMSGKVDGAWVKDTVFNSLAAKDDRVQKDLRVLVESESVPSNTFMVRSTLDPQRIGVLRDAMLGMHLRPAGREALRPFGAMRFLATAPEDFDRVKGFLDAARIDSRTYLGGMQ